MLNKWYKWNKGRRKAHFSLDANSYKTDNDLIKFWKESNGCNDEIQNILFINKK